MHTADRDFLLALAALGLLVGGFVRMLVMG